MRVGLRSRGAGDLSATILGLLAVRDMYGCEVARTVIATAQGAGVGGSASFAEGEVYPVLRSLERECLAVGRWVDVGEDVPRRRYYAITPRGIRVAAAGGLGAAVATPRGARP